MNGIEYLLQDITELTPLTIALAALAGLIVGVAPSSFPLIAVSAGLSTSDGPAQIKPGNIRGLWLSMGFAFGIATVDAALGALFGFAGFTVLRILTQAMAYLYGLLTVILLLTGLALWRLIRIPVPILRPAARPAQTFVGAYLLGLPFGLTTCPACTPLLLPVVIAASASADPIMGMVLLGSFGLARGVPIVIAGTAAASLGKYSQKRLIMLWAERIGGALLFLAAIYFATQSARYAGWL